MRFGRFWLLPLSLVACGSTTTSASRAASSPDAALVDSSLVDTDHTDVTIVIDDAGTEGSGDGTVFPFADAGVATPGTTGSKRLAAEAARELAAMKSSTYTHKTDVDELTGTFDYDCSGFVDYALSRVDPTALASLKAARSTRPLAKDFEQFFASLSKTTPAGGWIGVARVQDLVVGDVIAWLIPPTSTSTDTGHVLIVRQPPTPRAGFAGEFVIPIWDSTSTPHGASDSRTGSGATGLGTGTIALATDTSGAPSAYHWTTVTSSPLHPTSIALGHQP